MPSTFSRLLSTSSSTANNATAPTPARSTTKNDRDQSWLRSPPPQAAFDTPPTLHAERSLPLGPTSRQTSGSGRPNTHGRSTSHPLPMIFGRKKSARELGRFNDTDVPLDDDLVPVLREPAAAQATPTRVVSGKKGSGKPAEDEDKVTRRCMCCDCRVSVPRDLDRFRCMSCVTINDLKPPVPKTTDEKDEVSHKRAETLPGVLPTSTSTLPLTVERTRTVIDRCLMTYLEARCRRQEEHASTAPLKIDSAAEPWPEKSLPTHALRVRPRVIDNASMQLTDSPIATSPPDTPESEAVNTPATATIRDFTDIDLFSYMRDDTTPPPDQQHSPHGPGPPLSTAPKLIPARPTRKPPPPPVSVVTNRTPSRKFHPNGSATPSAQPSPRPHLRARPTQAEVEDRKRYERVKMIFKPLEDYLMLTFGDYDCLNTSFSTVRSAPQGRTRSDSNIPTSPPESSANSQQSPMDGLQELDAKTLLLGDLGENSSWWTGKLDRLRGEKSFKRKRVGEGSRKTIGSKSPNINWAELGEWYETVHTAGADWQQKVEAITTEEIGFSNANLEGLSDIENIEQDIKDARDHAVRAVLKLTENLLKRPTRPLKEPEDIRFLLIMLANPSMYPPIDKSRRVASHHVKQPERAASDKVASSPKPPLSPRKSPGGEVASFPHAGLLKRILGLLANSSEICHHYLIGWFARFDEEHFVRIVDLVASFVTYRISRRSSRPCSRSAVVDGGLIPDLSGSAMSTSAQLHSAMGLSGSVKKNANGPEGETDWANDWQVKAAAKLMSLLFAANNIWQGKRREQSPARMDSGTVVSSATLNGESTVQAKARRSGQLLHTSSFYNTLLDYHDLIADFKLWESKREKFAFCQFPLFLSMGAKIKILEYDARRQMEIKAREAYFDSVIGQRALDGQFHLRVRRECMVDDSLRQISEAVGAGQQELKKGLRVHFTGEEGVDAGGPRKEWFLMLVRDIFDPNHGMFVYDDESRTCYFNPNSFETSDQYYLVGALLGLAIYNSTILDIALPPFAFRKLLAAAPPLTTGAANVSSLTGTKGQMTYTVADLAEFRPSLAAGLQQLLHFDGDVEATYCRDFVAPVERYGTLTNVPLIPNGDGTPVTNANRHEFVDAYIRYLLDTSVARQFEPFKRGFFTVSAGNALSLFRAEEIELLVRGSDEALDVDSLRAVAVYENWRHVQPPHHSLPNPSETVPIIGWFWDFFAQASPDRQRKLLTFVTGSDRIPAVGATSLVLRIVAGGDGWGGGGKEERERFPVARTCFNMLVLWSYDYREQLEGKLWRAVEESEGFGLK